jgi:hypothetical protein
LALTKGAGIALEPVQPLLDVPGFADSSMMADDLSQRTACDLSQFSLGDMTRFGVQLRKIGRDASSMEEVADRSVRYLHEHLRGPGLDAPACALVRMFVTMPFSALQPDQQQFAETILGGAPPSSSMKCLTLLATAGNEPQWNSRTTSAGHKALPLPSPEAVARSPMIAQLIRQLGVEIGAFLSADSPLLIDAEQSTFNVFHVAEAPGSADIPAQREFVVPYGIRSVLGFGGLMPPGELFATILFSKTHIPRAVADLFKPLALNVKVALLPFAGRRVFA